VPLTNQMTFSGFDSITISASDPIVAVCPVITFDNVAKVTLTGLNITCDTTTDIETAPAVLFKNSKSTVWVS
jgi:hypothetical protein